MSEPIKVGDEVAIVDTLGALGPGAPSKGALYTVIYVNYVDMDLWIGLRETRGLWRASRFQVVKSKNPRTEIPLSKDSIDWKSRYENLLRMYNVLREESRFPTFTLGTARLFVGGKGLHPASTVCYKSSYPPIGKRWDYYRGWVNDTEPTTKLEWRGYKLPHYLDYP